MPGSDPLRPTADASLTLHTLGGASLGLTSAGTPSGIAAAILSPGKPFALLTYLACSPRRTASREHLVDLLWADLEPDKARHALRQTIWYLRQMLGPEGITAQGAELQLAAPIRLDRDDFLAAVGVGDLGAAAEFYQGDFLAGFAAPGGVEFEHWADVERQRLRVAFQRVAERLVRDWLDGGRFREATHLARRARDTARGSEAAWRLLLESLLASGEQLGFTLEAGALALMLDAEGREPEPATRALLQRDERPSPLLASTGRALVPALVGREREFGAIIASWEQVIQHGGHHLHLTAPPGLGKTRLLADVHRRLRGLGARVVSLRANPGDRPIPYSFAGELARALAELPGTAGVSPSTAGTLIALHPSLSGRFTAPVDSSTGDEALRRRSSALGELLHVASEDQPCALLLDDLHWADQVSRQALRPLLERFGAARLLIVTAARPMPGLDLDGEAAERISLHPLDVAHVTELLASLGQLPEAPWSSRLPALLREVTGGSPLLALETLQLALDRDLLFLAGGNWSCASWEALEQELLSGSALRHRIERLEPDLRSLLGLLALAGMPLSAAQLARAAHRDAGAIEPLLSQLEQRGLGQRVGELWQPAHDEIAALALELASESGLAETNAGLGAMFAEPVDASRAELARAARHFAAAELTGRLETLFRRYVRCARREGDGRRLAPLVEDFLPESNGAIRDRLVLGLGRWDRLRDSPVRNAALLGAAAIFGVVALVASRPRPVPDAELLVGMPGMVGESQRMLLPIFRQGWRSGQPLSRRTGTLLQATLPEPGMYWPLESPDGRRSVIVRETGDSNTYDLYLTEPDGGVRRIVGYPRDDVSPSWAPDGSKIVFVSSAWSPRGADNYDLAVYDITSGKVRQLTNGRGVDNQPLFSPEGSRIGFQRGNDDARAQVCWIALDGAGGPHCVSPSGMELLMWAGWLNEQTALVVVDSAANPQLGRMDLETGMVTLIEHHADGALLSPDGRWLAVLMERPGTSGARWYIEPSDAPEQRRELELPEIDPASVKLSWQWPSRPIRYLDSVEFQRLPDSIARDAPFLARVVGLDVGGAESGLSGPTRWASSDTTIFVVDSTGMIRPRRLGTATLAASVGGWRGASRSVSIVEPRRASVFSERWDGGLTRNFIPFGAPRPEVTTGPDGMRGMWNRGDGSYVSGVYSRQHWDASGGLGVEVLVSTRITRGQFQVMTISLLGGLDSLALHDWDHHTGSIPIDPGNNSLRSCVVGYPSGEGSLGRRRLAAYTGSNGRPIVVDSAIGDGHWYRLRIQIFQDGRCGIAMNGQPIWLSHRRLLTDRPYALELGYASADTKVLHGPLEVWQGVRDDVQWSLLEQH